MLTEPDSYGDYEGVCCAHIGRLIATQRPPHPHRTIAQHVGECFPSFACDRLGAVLDPPRDQHGPRRYAVRWALGTVVRLRPTRAGHGFLHLGSGPHHADLTGANLTFASLSTARLFSTDLAGASLGFSTMALADMSNANLAGAILNEWRA